MEETAKNEIHALLKDAIKLERSIAGTVQVFNSSDHTLEIVAHEGLKESYLEHFKKVRAFDSTSYGRAIGIGSPVLISDIDQDIGYKPHKKIAKAAGFRAVISVPIFSKTGSKLGVISNHFAEPRSKWTTDRLDEILPDLARVLQRLLDLRSGRPLRQR